MVNDRISREQAAASMMNYQIKRIHTGYENLMALYAHYPDLPVNWSTLTLTLDKLNAFRKQELDGLDTKESQDA